MRTTMNINPNLLAEAGRLTGMKEKTALVHAGLEALIARESAHRLAAMGGNQRSMRSIPRRRSSVALPDAARKLRKAS